MVTPGTFEGGPVAQRLLFTDFLDPRMWGPQFCGPPTPGFPGPGMWGPQFRGASPPESKESLGEDGEPLVKHAKRKMYKSTVVEVRGIWAMVAAYRIERTYMY